MEWKVMHVVGDRFSEFSSNESVIKVSELDELLSQSDASVGPNMLFMLGQGVAMAQAHSIMEKARRHGIEASFWFPSLEKAGHHLSHKHDPENIMISVPRKKDAENYELDVLIDEHCVEMSDHITGQHIQGMVLIEVSRQAFLAVTELFFLEVNEPSRYFVINSFNVNYNDFVFPLSARVKYQVQNVERINRKKSSFKVYMEIEQGGKVCCCIDVQFSAVVQDLVTSAEVRKAVEAIRIVGQSDALHFSKSSEPLIRKIHEEAGIPLE